MLEVVKGIALEKIGEQASRVEAGDGSGNARAVVVEGLACGFVGGLAVGLEHVVMVIG